MDDKTVHAINAALDQGHRVQIKKLKDGTIKVQIIFQKELKVS